MVRTQSFWTKKILFHETNYEFSGVSLIRYPLHPSKTTKSCRKCTLFKNLAQDPPTISDTAPQYNPARLSMIPVPSSHEYPLWYNNAPPNSVSIWPLFQPNFGSEEISTYRFCRTLAAISSNICRCREPFSGLDSRGVTLYIVINLFNARCEPRTINAVCYEQALIDGALYQVDFRPSTTHVIEPFVVLEFGTLWIW